MATIPFLHSRKLADGRTSWNWKPSKRLRDRGWTNRSLGTTATRSPSAAILTAALELNEQLAAWDKGMIPAAPTPPNPRAYQFADLVDAYRRAPAFTLLATASQREYGVRLRQLTSWADGGALPIQAIDKAMVRELRDTLTEGGASAHKVQAIMRVLRVLFNWAVDEADILATNPATGVKIRSAPSRSTIILPADVELAAREAQQQGKPSLARYFRLGLWTLQRQGDLLALNRMAWREMDNAAPADAAVLVGPKGTKTAGRVMGFRLRQQKTGAWLDVPVLPEFHADIEAAFAKGQWLFADDEQPERAYPQHMLQRRARVVLSAIGLDHGQLRDLRRSGMCMMRDLGCEDSGITAISGHAILGHRTILDTYMPKNTRTACATLATAERTRQSHQQMAQAK